MNRLGRAARAVAVLAALLGLAACATGPTGCVIHPLAQLPTYGTMPFVPVLVQNRPATLLVDTGAYRSVLSSSVVQAGAMTTHQTDRVINGVGGIGSNTIATVPSLTIGYATGRDVNFYVATLHGAGPNGKPFDGLFGGDFLANYDLLIDLPGHRVGLYETEGCTGANFAPLGSAARSMSFGVPGHSVRFETRIVFPAKLDGVVLPFILDSGAGLSYVTTRAAALAGTSQAALNADPTRPVTGLGDASPTAHLHRFKSFQLPVGFVRNPRLAVYEGSFNILGDDFLSHNRVWISYPLRRLYVQPVAQ